MARVRRTMEQIRRMKPRVDRAKIDSTTEADIRRHMIEDGQTPRTHSLGLCPWFPH
jgi:putative transcriptional regulator